MSTTITVTDEQARYFRLRRSGLVEPFPTPEAAAAALAGVQAQILPSAGLALWNRTPALSHAAFDALLHHERTLVKLWGQRGTLHLYPSAEWPLIYAALAGRPTWWSRQADRSGTADAYRATVEGVVALLRERGTLGRADLRAAGLGLDDELFSSWGGIFADLVRLGVACHAGHAGGEGRFAHREHWLPTLEWRPPPPDEANVVLALRYLRAYGPATAHDFAYWRGATSGDARRWFAALHPDLAEVAVGGRAMLVLRADLDELCLPPPPRDAWPAPLLGRFDPLLLGVKEKGWIVDPDGYKRVWRPAGHIEGTLLDHGRVAATWRYERAPAGLRLSVFPLAPLAAHATAALERAAPRVAAFFGLPLADLSLSGV